MSLIALLLLQGAVLTGLVVGRRAFFVPLLATVPAATQFAGLEAGALALLSSASFVLGAHLRRLIAEQYVR